MSDEKTNSGAGERTTGQSAENDTICHEFIDTGRCRHSDSEHDAMADGKHDWRASVWNEGYMARRSEGIHDPGALNPYRVTSPVVPATPDAASATDSGAGEWKCPDCGEKRAAHAIVSVCPAAPDADDANQCYCPPANVGDGIKPQPDCLIHGGHAMKRDPATPDAADTSERGLHPCEGCGIELDDDDPNDRCDECASAASSGASEGLTEAERVTHTLRSAWGIDNADLVNWIVARCSHHASAAATRARAKERERIARAFDQLSEEASVRELADPNAYLRRTLWDRAARIAQGDA